MDDNLPLLNSLPRFSSASDRRTSKHKNANIFTKLHRYFHHEKSEGDYQELDGDEKSGDQEKLVSLFYLVRLMDRIDFFLILIGLIGVACQATSYTANLVFFGRLTAILAEMSFSEACPYQQQSSFLNNTVSNNGCSFNLDLNGFNSEQSYSLCNHSEFTTHSSSILSASTSASRTQAISFIRLMLIFGAVQFVATIFEVFTFMVFAKRQVSRISVRLFQTIIQRSISYLDISAAGQLHTKLSEHVNTIGNGIGLDLALMFESTLCSLLSIIMAFIFNWRLTLIMLCSLPIIAGSSYLFSKVCKVPWRIEAHPIIETQLLGDNFLIIP